MSLPKSKVAVLGLGYIGLPTSAVLASVGHEVLGVEMSSHIAEPDYPERILPRSIATELVKNDHVIVGGLTPIRAAKTHQLYETFVRGRCIDTRRAWR